MPVHNDEQNQDRTLLWILNVIFPWQMKQCRASWRGISCFTQNSGTWQGLQGWELNSQLPFSAPAAQKCQARGSHSGRCFQKLTRTVKQSWWHLKTIPYYTSLGKPGKAAGTTSCTQWNGEQGDHFTGNVCFPELLCSLLGFLTKRPLEFVYSAFSALMPLQNWESGKHHPARLLNIPKTLLWV